MIPKLYTPAPLTEPLDLFGQMLAQAPFAIWMADRDGKVVMFNEAMRNLVGIDDPDRVLEKYNIFEDPIAKSQGLIPYIRRVLTGQVIETVVMMDLSQEDFNAAAKADPKVFYVRCLYFPLKDERGDFEYVVQLVENITQDYMEDLDLSRSANELETASAEILKCEKEIISFKKKARALTLQRDALKKDV